MIEKLILGTAGLGGLPYGRERRVVSRDEAREVLARAYELGIRIFDTAPAYGFAEELLSELPHDINVYTKTNGDQDLAANSLEILAKHGVKFLYHNWNGHPLPPWCCGVTAYRSEIVGVNKLIAHCPQFLVQGEWNLLSQQWTQRLDKRGLFIARSTFLQGVLAGDPYNAPSFLKDHVERANRVAKAFGCELGYFALRAALEHPCINTVVVGPQCIAELESCVRIASGPGIGNGRLMCVLNVENDSLTDPRKWAA
jgi:aryl-alcohol dehydrogenase-like predicted oxidoreductase